MHNAHTCLNGALIGRWNLQGWTRRLKVTAQVHYIHAGFSCKVSESCVREKQSSCFYFQMEDGTWWSPLVQLRKARISRASWMGSSAEAFQGWLCIFGFTASLLTFRAWPVSNQSRLAYLSCRHTFCVLAVFVLQQSEAHSLLIAMTSASRVNGCRISAPGTVRVLQVWLAHVVHTHSHSQASIVPKFLDLDIVSLLQSFSWPKTQRSTVLILCLYLTPN